ncbi:MAG: transposase [Chloroflexi bacterium]|nr:transposase [Chloroflexota bacterium]
MRYPEGESDHGLLWPLFDRRLKLEFQGSRVTSDAGLLAYRELDDALGLTALAGGVVADSRTGRNGWHGIVGLPRQSVYGRPAGYEDVNDAKRVVAFYNQRGTAEQWIEEGKNAIRWTRLSCRRFDHNAVRLQLHGLAYNLGNFMLTLALPDAVEQWSLTSLREKLIKIGAKIVRHGRYVTFRMAKVVIPRDLFADILRRIDRLRPPPAPA